MGVPRDMWILFIKAHMYIYTYVCIIIKTDNANYICVSI